MEILKVLLFLLVIIYTIIGTTVWGNKNQITSSPDVSPIETCTGEDAKIAYPSAGDPQGDYNFGYSISISGDTLAVSSYGANQNETGASNFSGVVYVYTDGNFDLVPTKVAIPSTGAPQSLYFFGFSISISGDTLVVGAFGANQDGTSASNTSGSVYVYTDGNYGSVPIKVANPSDGPPLASYNFGYSVSISGDTLAVGAYGANQDGVSAANNSGAVYVYTNGNYGSVPIKVANPSDGPPLASYNFGRSVSISGDTLAVGAVGANQDGVSEANNSGAVYVYTNGNYASAPTKVANPSEGPPLASYLFGRSVSISGDTLAVGAVGANQDGVSAANNSGAVYVYLNGAYDSTPTKVADPSTGPPLASYNFGFSIFISGDTLVVGAFGANQDGVSGANFSGLAYVYKDGNYDTAPTRLAILDATPDDDYYYGIGVTTSGNRVIVGASGQTSTGTGFADNAGGAYIYPCAGF